MTSVTLCLCVQQSAKSYPTLWDPKIVAYQAPVSMGFSSQQYWSGWLFHSPRDLPDPGIKSRFLGLQAGSLPLSHQGRPHIILILYLRKIFKFCSLSLSNILYSIVNSVAMLYITSPNLSFKHLKKKIFLSYITVILSRVPWSVYSWYSFVCCLLSLYVWHSLLFTLTYELMVKLIHWGYWYMFPWQSWSFHILIRLNPAYVVCSLPYMGS